MKGFWTAPARASYETALALAVAVSLIGSLACAEQSGGPGGPPFPNDYGPGTVDISKYPPDLQAKYRLFARRCSQCHTIARPINSQYLELSPEEQAAARAKEPDLFKNDQVWHVEEHVWSRFVKRMMAKPGANIQNEEAKKIWQFLVEDSQARKMGDNREMWRLHRQKLLDDFKKSFAKRYDELFQK